MTKKKKIKQTRSIGINQEIRQQVQDIIKKEGVPFKTMASMVNFYVQKGVNEWKKKLNLK